MDIQIEEGHVVKVLKLHVEQPLEGGVQHSALTTTELQAVICQYSQMVRRKAQSVLKPPGLCSTSSLYCRKQSGDGRADGTPAAFRALFGQLLQLDVQCRGEQDRGGVPGVPSGPLQSQRPADRSGCAVETPMQLCV
jgi:hypothetical protein